jgi:hypothetical protein
MLTGLPALEATNWSELHHAYGRATDTPDHLRALLNGDADAREMALFHLWSAVIHQGTPWSATGPVALVVAGMMADQRIDRGDRPVRIDLLSFLVSVAEASAPPDMSTEELERLASYDVDALINSGGDDALYENDDAANALFARSVLGCIAATPVLMNVMLNGLEDANPRVRAGAAMGAVALAKIGPLRSNAADLSAKLLGMARHAETTDERSAHMLALGDLGCAPVEYLEDPSPAVRVCAAMAPALAQSPHAINQLVEAIEHHAVEIDQWFTERPPQFSMRARFYVIARVVERATDFARFAGGAADLIGITSKFCVDQEWGPLLACAFPDGSGSVKTEAQRHFLRALTNRADLWDRTFGNAQKWFKKAGLPLDREDCKKRLKRL